jgi:hypothetical protein
MKQLEYQALRREEFPQNDWAEKLIRPLNQVLGNLRLGLANNLTLGENLNAQVKVLDITAPDPWVTVTLINSWVPYGSTEDVPSYCIEPDGWVALRGAMKSGSTGTQAFILPTGPKKTHRFLGVSSTVCQILVYDSGAVLVSTGTTSYIGLSMIRFQPAVASAPTSPIVRFTTTVKGRVVGMVVLRCAAVNGRDETAIGLSAVGWDQDGETVTIRSIPGLIPGQQYRLTVAVFGG